MIGILRKVILGAVVLVAACSCQQRYETGISLAVDYNDTYPLKVPAQAGSCLVLVTSNQSWEASLSDGDTSWCSLENASGDGRGYVKFYYGENTSSESRSVRFVATAGKESVGFPIIQQGE